MIVLGIDPGPTASAWCAVEDGKPMRWGKEPNEAVIQRLKGDNFGIEWLVIEKIACYGMAVGEEVFETVYFSGRFAQVWGEKVARVTRKEVALHLCQSARAGDANVRCALIDRFGGKEKAIGKKANPGPLYGISGDVWSALAVALTWQDTAGHAITNGAP